MSRILLLVFLTLSFVYAEPSQCKDELASAIIISTTAIESAKANVKDETLLLEIKDLEESSNLLLFYYHNFYGESIMEDKVERTIKRVMRKCKDVRCMLDTSANHLQKLQDLKCNITKF